LKTIFRRSFSGFVVVIIILAVLAPLLIYNSIRSRLNALAVSNLSRTAEALEYTFAPLLERDRVALDSIADALGSRLDLRITLISRDGTVLADSEEQPDSMENHRTRPEVIAAFNGETGTSSRRSETLDREMLYVAIPVHVDGSIPVVIRTSLFFSDQQLLLNDILVDMLIVMAAVLLAGLVFAWFSSRSYAGPIREVADATRRAGEGDYSVRIPPFRIRELDALAGDINSMISRTDELIQELSRNSNKLDAILDSIVEGLVVLDPAGRIVATNRSFRRMSGSFETDEGTLYLDMVSDGSFRDFFNQVLNEGLDSGEITTGGRIYSARTARVPGTQNCVLTFRDITEISETVRVKREFAANASHELRTPLTSIKGYAETVLEDMEGPGRRYMKTILRNTDRLIRIVEDMRILSELEQPMTSLDLEETDLTLLIGGTLELFRSQAEEKGLELLFESERESVKAMIDRFRIEQVFINLIENAVKYTTDGSVTVRVSARAGFVTAVVSDTGTGISEEHLSRLFERFYVVDKARSRSRGGTGLGLAIVKHIVGLHGGWIRVSSTPGSGSMFTVGLPAEPPAPG